MKRATAGTLYAGSWPLGTVLSLEGCGMSSTTRVPCPPMIAPAFFRAPRQAVVRNRCAPCGCGAVQPSVARFSFRSMQASSPCAPGQSGVVICIPARRLVVWENHRLARSGQIGTGRPARRGYNDAKRRGAAAGRSRNFNTDLTV